MRKNAKLITDHTFTKHRKLVHDTKKGCLVVFNTKKLSRIPKYKIPADTRYNRDKAAKLVKKFLLPQNSQRTKEQVLDEEYNLSYLIQLPKGKHCYHNTRKASEIAEPLDPTVTDEKKTSYTMTCAATGKPIPNVTWYKQGNVTPLTEQWHCRDKVWYS